jgi:hypothetical protein
VQGEQKARASGPKGSLVAAVALGLLAGVAGTGKAVEAKPAGQPTVPAPPDTQVLFDGQSLSGWVQRGSDAPARWKVQDGVLEVVPGTGDICTRQEFTDFQLHVEFNEPYMPNAHGQARGNSGVYLQGSYEIQVLDSYGLKPQNDDCGAIYGQTPPMVNGLPAAR